MSLTNEQAAATASALLGLDPQGGNHEKVASEEVVPTVGESYEALGREYAGAIIKQAAADVVEERVQEGLFKVAQAAVIDSISQGTIDGYIKMAAGDDEVYAQALKATIFGESE